MVNATNLVAGGGVQVAVSFINEFFLCFDSLSIDIDFYVSKNIFYQLDDKIKKTLSIFLVEISPNSLFKGFGSRKYLRNVSKNYTTVFSIFGPIFWRPKSRYHIVGFANPWLIYDTSDALNSATFFKKSALFLKYKIYKFFFRYNSTALVAETHDVSQKLKIKFVGLDNFVVSNCASSSFLEHFDDSRSFNFDFGSPKPVILLCLGYNHYHKNYDISGSVSKYLFSKYGFNLRFVFTLDEQDYKSFSIETINSSINIGRVSYDDIPHLYKCSDGLFLPTFLECFSANYPEAMISKIPIFTSDRSFSKTVCSKYAVYFEPRSIEDVAESIYNYFLLPDCEKINFLNNAYEYVRSFPTAKDRMLQYIKIINIYNL